MSFEDQLKRRVESLKQEYQSGQQMLAEQQAKVQELERTLLRISGAIQVLEEELESLDSTPVTDAKGDIDA